MSKTEYAYTTGTVGTATKVYNYTYGNAWKDQLTAFDGSTITYDASGNPTNYLGKALTWSRGRLLTKYVSGSKTVDIQYDGKGIRVAKTRKIGTSVTTNSTYIYDNGGKLRTEIEGNTTRNYIYGQDGIVGYEENNEHFMYRKNIFGDITAIYKGATKVAEYKYDAWGNCTIILNTSGYGSRNPFRYRGYYFDSDLGMYYLTTRYYDPKTGRFINADSIEYLKPDAINGLNLYAYCRNNPIRYVDPSGHEPLSGTVAIWLLASIYALLFTAGYIYSKNAPPSEQKDLLEGSNIHFEDKWFDFDFRHPYQIGKNRTFGIGFDLSVWKGIMYFDSGKSHSLHTSIGNAGIYAGIDYEEGIGIDASANVAEVGYDGRFIDASLYGLSVGFTLMYSNGSLEFGYGALLWGWSVGIDLIELYNLLVGGK